MNTYINLLLITKEESGKDLSSILGGKMKIKSVEIWGMHNVLHKKYDFSNVNYFFGKNGSGKTTVLQAVQLALLGYIPGTNKKAQDIFTHSCAPEMKVSLVFDNGYNVTRSYKKTSSR